MAKKPTELGTLLYTGNTDSGTPDDQRQFTTIEPTDEQQRAIVAIEKWLEAARRGEDGKLFVLGGFAGTGKTAVTGILARDLVRKYRVAFAAPTGMAAAVLARSLAARGVFPDYCGTLHRLLYRPTVDEMTGERTGWERKETLDYDFLVVDEASMVSSELLDDLVSYNIPMLAVGDHGQLPPVGEEVSLMARPNARLEQVHRQALDNPVVAFSVAVRRGEDWRAIVRASTDSRLQYLDAFESTALVMDRYRGFRDRAPSEDPLVICGMNRTRRMLNEAARSGLGPELVPGDRITCLRNQYLNETLLANGFRGVVKSTAPTRTKHQILANVTFPDESLDLIDGKVCKTQFGAERALTRFTDVEGCRSWEEVGLLFDWGNAYTCHRSIDVDTILRPCGQKPKKIKDFQAGDRILGVDDNGLVIETAVVALHDHGLLEGLEITFEGGYQITCSAKHKFLTIHGMKPIEWIIQNNEAVLCAASEGRRMVEPLRGSPTVEAGDGPTPSGLLDVSVSQETTRASGHSQDDSMRHHDADKVSPQASGEMRRVPKEARATPAKCWMDDLLWNERIAVPRPTRSSETMSGLHRSGCRYSTQECHPTSGIQSNTRSSRTCSAGSSASCSRSSHHSGSDGGPASVARTKSRKSEGTVSSWSRKLGPLERKPSREGRGARAPRDRRAAQVGDGAPGSSGGKVAAPRGDRQGRGYSKKMERGEPGEVPRDLRKDIGPHRIFQNRGVAPVEPLAVGGCSDSLWERSQTSGLRLPRPQDLGGSGRIPPLLRGLEDQPPIAQGSGPRRDAESRGPEERGRDAHSSGGGLFLDRQWPAPGRVAPVAYANAPLTDTGGLVRRRVVRVRYVGPRRMYDLEVAHPKHNFLLPNGIVTSNSQGQQRRDVIVLVEDFAASAEEFRRWLYTATSRATTNLTVMF